MVASHASVGGNPMAPPKLARDAPVVDVLQPIEKRVLPELRMKGRVTVAHRLDRAISHRAHRQEPLLGEHRLDDGVASRAYADGVPIRLDFFEQPRNLEVFNDFLARILARHPAIRTAVLVDVGGAVEDRDLLEAVMLAQLEVHRVVRGCDFQRAGAEFSINRCVGDYLYLAPYQRQG